MNTLSASLACVVAVAGLLSPAARAAEPPSAGRPASASASTGARSASTPGGNDTLEFLHQRLEERLGSVRQPTDDGTMLLKVPARSGVSADRSVPRPRPNGVAKGDPKGDPKGGRSPVEALSMVAWDYSGPGGPTGWAGLKPEYALCGSGARQSPIDLRDGFAVDLEPLVIDYQPTPFRVIDNGRTVQVNLAPGNTLAVGGRRFELQHLRFHRPSEESVQGRRFDMGVHLVHRDEQGRIAVLAVLLERGGAQPVVQQVWNNLPLEKGVEQPAREPMDASRLLPDDRRYFTTMGSLTAPPCSEGVLWLVLKQPVPVAAEQIELFARLYPMNARPLQPANGRMIKESR